MAQRDPELSTDTKKAIAKLVESGLSGRKIAERLGINPSAVHKFLKRYRQRNSEENTSRTGRPRKCNDRTHRQLLRLVKTEGRTNLHGITNLLNERTPVKISKTTVKRSLKLYGFKRRVVKKKLFISNANRFKRRAWCRSKLHCSVNTYWKDYFFLMNLRFVLGNTVKFMSGEKTMRNGLNLVLEKRMIKLPILL